LLRVTQGPFGNFGNGGIFSAYRHSARLFDCLVIILVSIPTELSAVTHMSLFLHFHECL